LDRLSSVSSPQLKLARYSIRADSLTSQHWLRLAIGRHRWVPLLSTAISDSLYLFRSTLPYNKDLTGMEDYSAAPAPTGKKGGQKRKKSTSAGSIDQLASDNDDASPGPSTGGKAKKVS